jgi:hypothetical protein
VSTLIIVAIIAAFATIGAAVINSLVNRKTYSIVRGNGKGNVSEMNEKLLALAERLEFQLGNRMDRQERHMERQDGKLDKLDGRVGVIEAWGYNMENRAEDGRKVINDHLNRQDKTAKERHDAPSGEHFPPPPVKGD